MIKIGILIFYHNWVVIILETVKSTTLILMIDLVVFFNVLEHEVVNHHD